MEIKVQDDELMNDEADNISCNVAETSSSLSTINFAVLIQCKECFSVFSTEQELHKHASEHTANQHFIYECENCKMTFSDQEYLARHQIRCKNHTFSSFRCDICQRGFTTKGSLDLHVDAVHLKKREYGCSLCGKLYSRKHILKVHLATHYGKRDFICSTCGKSFLQKSNLNRHERIHEAKNFAYKCRFCGQRFTQNKHLQRHLSSHKVSEEAVPTFISPDVSKIEEETELGM